MNMDHGSKLWCQCLEVRVRHSLNRKTVELHDPSTKTKLSSSALPMVLDFHAEIWILSHFCTKPEINRNHSWKPSKQNIFDAKIQTSKLKQPAKIHICLEIHVKWCYKILPQNIWGSDGTKMLRDVNPPVPMVPKWQWKVRKVPKLKTILQFLL